MYSLLRSVVAGEVDTIEFLAGRNVHDVVEEIKTKAIAKAIASGADVATTKIVEVINLPVQYVTNEATRIIVKAAGDLAPLSIASLEDSVLASADSEENSEGEKAIEDTTAAAEDVTLVESAIDIDTYKPTILANHTWKVSEVDLGESLPWDGWGVMLTASTEWIAEGCGVLGTGGGGSPYPPFLMARQMLRDGKQIIIEDPDNVSEKAMFFRCSFMVCRICVLRRRVLKPKLSLRAPPAFR